MKLRSIGRFIGWKLVVTGYFLGLLIWVTDKFEALHFLRPTALLEAPGVPHPSILGYALIMLTMFSWARHRLLADPIRRRWAEGDFFFCLHWSAQILKGIISLLVGIALATLTCFFATGSQGALLAFAWSVLVIVQQSLVLAFLFQLAVTTKWNKPRFALL